MPNLVSVLSGMFSSRSFLLILADQDRHGCMKPRGRRTHGPSQWPSFLRVKSGIQVQSIRDHCRTAQFNDSERTERFVQLLFLCTGNVDAVNKRS